MSDILFQKEQNVFSYRVAAVCLHERCVLLQKPTNDTAYAFPGGHVAFGETHAETLVREFQEEMGARLTVGELKWVGELFFPWGSRKCTQICLYYDAKVDGIPLSGSFMGRETLEGRNFDMEFHWVPLDRLPKLEVYPVNAAEMLANYDKGVQKFVYREEE
ncbi:MAG: NUDIX hydrolase [Eubacteriales bacterium]